MDKKHFTPILSPFGLLYIFLLHRSFYSLLGYRIIMDLIKKLFRFQRHQWYNHFFQRDSPMLKSICIKRYIVLIVVGIGKEIVASIKNIACADVRCRQPNVFGFQNIVHFLSVVLKIASQFVSQVCIQLFITHYFQRFLYSDGSMIRREDDFGSRFAYGFQQL